jgi:uncharacterized protein YndB with AHSA1/START domain
MLLCAAALPTFTPAVHAIDDPGDVPLSKRILRKEAVVKASPADAWHAWTTSEGIASFFSKESMIELRIGGPYELYMGGSEPDAAGKRGSQGCKILSYIPQRMLAFEWNFPPKLKSLRESGAKTQVVLRFDDLGDGRVRVRFAQLGWQDGDDWQAGYEYFEEAWDWVMSQFEQKIGGGDTPDRRSPVDQRRGSDVKKSWVDGHLRVTATYGAQQSQSFEMEIPVPVEKVWNAIATEDGFRVLGAAEPRIELRPDGAYRFWPQAPNKVLAFVPQEMLSTSGSAPPEFPNVRKGGSWSAYELEAGRAGSTRLVLTCLGWRPGEKEWDDAFEYFLKSNPVFLNQLYDKLVGERRLSHVDAGE